MDAAHRVSSALERRGVADEGPDHRPPAGRTRAQERVALARDVDGVGQLDDAGALGQPGRERPGVAQGRERVEVAADDEQRHGGRQAPGAGGHGRRDAGDPRPVQAGAVCLAVGAHGQRLGQGERRERAGRPRADRRRELRPPGGGRGAHREELRVVRARHRDVEAVGEVGGRVRAGGGLGRQTQERHAVAGQRGPDRGVELAVHDGVGAGVLDEVDQDARADPGRGRLTVGGAGRAAERGGAETVEQRAQPGHRARRAGGRRAAGVARTDRLEGVAPRGARRRVPGVQAPDGVGRVEHDRVQRPGMTGHERLAEPGAVGVAVEVDAAEPEAAEHGGEVVDGVGGREEVGRVAAGPQAARVAPVDPPRAARHARREGRRGRDARVALQARAADERRRPRPAVVHEQQPPRAQERAVDPGVLDGAADRGEPGSALDGDERRSRGAAAGGRAPAEGDPDPGPARVAGVEPPRQRAAPPRAVVGAAVQGGAPEPHLPRGPRRPRGRDAGDGPGREQHEHPERGGRRVASHPPSLPHDDERYRASALRARPANGGARPRAR